MLGRVNEKFYAATEDLIHISSLIIVCFKINLLKFRALLENAYIDKKKPHINLTRI